MNKIIEFKHINKSYGGRPIIEDFNLSIEEGAFVCLIGTSGSGKTTILKMINGMVQPDSGELTVYGESVQKQNPYALRRQIGYAIQGNSLFPHMTVYENIAYVPKLAKKSKEDIDDIVHRMLGLVSLPESVLEKYPDELSGGQQQRVGLARAYANGASILLLDEPFGAVDSITKSQLQKDLKDIHRRTGCTIVFITHDLREAFKLGTHILVMDKGAIQQYDTVDEVRFHPKNEFVEQLVALGE